DCTACRPGAAARTSRQDSASSLSAAPVREHHACVRRFLFVLAASCHGGSHAVPDATPQPPDAPVDAGIDAPPDAPPDAGVNPTLQAVYTEVDSARIIQLMKDLSGVNPVTVGANTFTINERFSDTGRANFRAYWTNYM